MRPALPQPRPLPKWPLIQDQGQRQIPALPAWDSYILQFNSFSHQVCWLRTRFLWVVRACGPGLTLSQDHDTSLRMQEPVGHRHRHLAIPAWFRPSGSKRLSEVLVSEMWTQPGPHRKAGVWLQPWADNCERVSSHDSTLPSGRGWWKAALGSPLLSGKEVYRI